MKKFLDRLIYRWRSFRTLFMINWNESFFRALLWVGLGGSMIGLLLSPVLIWGLYSLHGVQYTFENIFLIVSVTTIVWGLILMSSLCTIRAVRMFLPEEKPYYKEVCRIFEELFYTISPLGILLFLYRNLRLAPFWIIANVRWVIQNVKKR